MRLLNALDNEICIVTKKFLSDGIKPDVDAIHQAIQRSNSSLKRRPRKVLQASIERALEFIDAEIIDDDDYDSQAAIEESQPQHSTAADLMNKSLRANLVPSMSAPPSPAVNGDDDRPKKRKANGEAVQKRPKIEKVPLEPPSGVSLDDLGGIPEVIVQMAELLVMPLLAPERYADLKLSMPRGILLHGPPGCGKTTLSRAFAAELGLPFIELLGPSIVSSMSGESEKGVRERFEEATKNAPCLLFIDEIDAIAPKRESSQSQMEKRIVSQLLISMDQLERDAAKPVIVLAATNRPDSLDPALRRGGRFDTEINMGVPNERVREEILKAQTRGIRLAADVDFKLIAKYTAGFVGADLRDLVGKAGTWQMGKLRNALLEQAVELEEPMNKVVTDIPEVLSLRRLAARLRRKDLPDPPGFESDTISMEAFTSVLPSIIPSSKREGFATIPDVSWEDIGALRSVREELQNAIVEPIKHPERYAAVGISAPTGVLLWGPPGCGKTLLAKAVAAESQANFISIKGPELLDKYLGESEAAVRRVFNRARSSIPCVIFFDELDALAPRRDSSFSEASSRVVNMLLTELDGVSNRTGIYVIGATNRPDIIDDAMLRPGRLETPLFVDLPGPSERVEILQALIRNKPIPPEMADVAATQACNGYSGADLESLLRKAGQHALKRKAWKMEREDLEYAVTVIKGSVGSMERYDKLKARFAQRI